jgi:hypothetical protein
MHIKYMDIVNKIQAPLDDSEIRQYIPSMKIITNKELEKYDKIEDVFDNWDRNIDSAVILFLDSPNTGHWTGLAKYGPPNDTFIEFFDSYGKSPKAVYNYVPKDIRMQLGTGKNYLNKLLNETSHKVIYNPIKYQEDNTENMDVNTCGRHVAFRLISLLGKGLTLPEYYQYMKKERKIMKNAPYDAVVTALIDI